VDFMAGRTGSADRAEPMPYLRAYVGPEDCAQAFAAAAELPDYTGYETFFRAAADAFAEQPTVARLEALYGASIPVREPAQYADAPQASPVSNAHARSRLGWRPTTRWSGSNLVTTPAA
jgi:nucleoside-diphosphate-sugar epimerase